MVIVNADDLGRSKAETDAALSLYKLGRITSVSAMVFMEDSERAAELAREAGVDVGLHINFSQRFTGTTLRGPVHKHHDKIVKFLAISKYALILYHPGLRIDFIHDYQTQVEEFLRLYGKPPSHFDGHQHMHLCSNMVLDNLIPRGAKVRRNFSFLLGEKDILNRSYRYVVDCLLARRYRLTDFFFALSQSLDYEHLRRIGGLGRKASVELMSHPVKPDEYAGLMSEDYLKLIGPEMARSR